MKSRGRGALGHPGWAVACLVLLPACAASGSGAESGPQVVAAFYPYAFVAERVAGDHASVTNLTAPGLEPHDLELAPQQVADIEKADVVVFERGFQPAVDEAVDQNAQGDLLDVASVVALEDTGAPTDAEGDDPAVLAGGEAPTSDGDPHVWLDPTRLAAVTTAFGQAITQADPAHARDYRRNTRALMAELARLDRDYAAGLAHCDRRSFVTSHAAFGYLARRYDLQMIAISGLSPDSDPSPARLKELGTLMDQLGVTTVFSEVLSSPELAETLANELHLQTAVLDPVEGLADSDPTHDYLSIMRVNLAALREAGGCS